MGNTDEGSEDNAPHKGLTSPPSTPAPNVDKPPPTSASDPPAHVYRTVKPPTRNRIPLRIPHDMMVTAKGMAKIEGVSLHSLVLFALHEYLERHVRDYMPYLMRARRAAAEAEEEE